MAERRGIILRELTEEDDRVFNNSRKIKDVQCPILIMHGAGDNLIYPDEAKLNYRNAGSENKKLVILPGVGHNDILYAEENLYFSTLSDFLSF